MPAPGDLANFWVALGRPRSPVAEPLSFSPVRLGGLLFLPPRAP